MITAAAMETSDFRELMRTVTRAAVPHLGDWCAIHFVGEPNTAPFVEAAHTDPAKMEWVQELQEKYTFDPDAPTGVAAVIRTGEPEHIEVDDAFLEYAVQATTIMSETEAREIVGALSLTSIINVPLITKRGVVGAMQFVSAESGRHYTSDDLALAEAAAAGSPRRSTTRGSASSTGAWRPPCRRRSYRWTSRRSTGWTSPFGTGPPGGQRGRRRLLRRVRDWTTAGERS